jgi:hypothetical protein
MLRTLFRLPPTLVLAVLLAPSAVAGEADVVDAKVTLTGPGVYRFEATVRHADSGWTHYADRWEVLAPDGTVLASRELLHPHDDEQPFTRSLSGVRIPPGTATVTIRAHDSAHGYGGKEAVVRLVKRNSE